MPTWNKELQQWGFLYWEEYSPGEWLGMDRSNYDPLEHADILNKIAKENRMNNYEIDSQTEKQIENIFTYHAPKGDQPERYVLLRDKAKELAYLIARNCPPSRERSLAITHLESCIYCANAAIARNE